MRAKRRFGQNFLVGRHYPQRIVEAVSPQVHETIIEIGPGRGALTGLLVESGARVCAVELDSELIPELNERFAGRGNFHLVEADALTVDLCSLIAPAETARVVSNLPYYISTPILQRLIEQRRCLPEMTLMLQREVVDRIAAAPGGKEYGYLSVLVQLYCRTERLFDVPPGAFRPAPKVHSSVVRLRAERQPRAEVEDEGLFISLAQILFAQRRKTILNNLRAAAHRLELPDESQMVRALEDSSIDPRRRAETLSIHEIALLTRSLEKSRGVRP
ncbi:MAG TPA: 16S rRNA (adenine(1518)-N(6)/adenine(1519)-N(6))-dimethyltransferase RsmA [Blastocatellia bacterium]|nr:16S rRNA (adenine(1518)-N(6)/adenine(1519)-N(6))-dimethyltransferase RsmA [Blastocatellia bacterium]